MIFKQAAIAAFSAILSFSTLTAVAQTAGTTGQSGADFGSGSAVKKPDDTTSDGRKKSQDTPEGSTETADKTRELSTPSNDSKPETVKSEDSKSTASKEGPGPETNQDASVQSSDTKETSLPVAVDTPAKSSGPVTMTTGTETNASKPDAGPEQTETAIKAPSTKPAGLTVASWGGAYTESQKRAYFSPFEVETGIAITAVSHKGQFDPLKGSGDSASATWDIVDVDLSTLDSACKDGMLEKVAATALADTKDGKPASSDFFPGTLHECGIPSVAWSSAIVFDKRAFKKAKPKTARDFFDTKRFPGKRVLPKHPKYVVELAMMAAGVKPENVYEELSTDDGVAQAFEQLDLIRDDILWWEKAHQPLSLLAKKDAAIALAFNGRIFSAIVAENKPFGIIWDGQVFDLDFWAIPKGSSRKEASLKFIAFATRPESLAKQASWFPYGPVRKSAVELVGTHPEVNVDMAAYIPTAPANFKRALRLDTLWWKENGKKIRDRYEAWIDGTFDSSSFEDEQQ